MSLLAKTKELCQLYNIRPARSKGQNFLVEEKIYDEIIAAADIQKDDLVLEVGPGLGFLTEKLAAKAGRVVAVELDKKLAEILQTKIIAQKLNNVSVVNEDILRFDLANFSDRIFQKQPYKIVANLPYNITSIFLRNFSETEPKPEAMILMLQKEVAERIVARPPAMSLLSVALQFYSEPKILSNVPAENFWPQPEVESAIIKIKLLSPAAWQGKYRTDCPPAKQFFRLVRMGFAAKRKMLKNNVASGLKIAPAEVEKTLIKCGYNAKIRAQELSVADWLILFANFRGFMI
jgi:16S rRNA (adenine1518-N6/adenine1519-N6)-dimethyltransferase